MRILQIDEETKLDIFLIYNVEFIVRMGEMYQNDSRFIETLRTFMGDSYSLNRIKYFASSKHHFCENLIKIRVHLKPLVLNIRELPYNPYIDLVIGMKLRMEKIYIIASLIKGNFNRNGEAELLNLVELKQTDILKKAIESYLEFLCVKKKLLNIQVLHHQKNNPSPSHIRTVNFNFNEVIMENDKRKTDGECGKKIQNLLEFKRYQPTKDIGDSLDRNKDMQPLENPENTHESQVSTMNSLKNRRLIQFTSFESLILSHDRLLAAAAIIGLPCLREVPLKADFSARNRPKMVKGFRRYSANL